MVLSSNLREIIKVSGNDARDFLQGLVTNDVNKIDQGLVYTALLTPQGKFLFDFFIFADGADVMIDVASDQSKPLLKRLMMYRLRADVEFNIVPLYLQRGLGMPPEGGYADPRHRDMGWRRYSPNTVADDVDWTARRIAALVPEPKLQCAVRSNPHRLQLYLANICAIPYRDDAGLHIRLRVAYQDRVEDKVARY